MANATCTDGHVALDRSFVNMPEDDAIRNIDFADIEARAIFFEFNPQLKSYTIKWPGLGPEVPDEEWL